MDDREERKLTNYLTRKVILDAPENAAAIASIPVLAEVVAEWDGLVVLIQTLGNKQGADLTGIAAAKKSLRELMTKRALVVRHKIGPFAARTSDAVLAATVDVSITDFHDARDTEVDDIAIRILDAAETNEAPLLASYGLKATQLDELESAITGFSALLGKPLAAIKVRKSLTEQIDAEFAAADALLETQLDPLVASLGGEFSGFAAAYANAMRLGSSGGGTTPATPAPTP